MTWVLNSLDQPIGVPLPDWKPPLRPGRETMEGRFCRLEPLHPAQHAAALYAAYTLDVEGRGWTYLPHGPFHDLESYRAWMQATCLGDDPLFVVIIEHRTGQPVGVASYLNIAPARGSIEVGSIHFSPLMQKSPVATEAMYLMMQQAFTLGYRRYEWKCDTLNAASRAAAQRLGFSYEGIFRQATVYKGRNRDTAWYAMIDAEWPALRQAFLTWLAPENFDEHGRQRIQLSVLTRGMLTQQG